MYVVVCYIILQFYDLLRHGAGELLLFQAVRMHRGLAFSFFPFAFDPFATVFIEWYLQTESQEVEGL